MKASTDTSHEYKLQQNISHAFISNVVLYELQPSLPVESLTGRSSVLRLT